jgi:hypothetical protein
MTTPKQAPLELDTPYGKVTVRDLRNHESFKKGKRQRVAVLNFPNLTINRKSYGDADLYLAEDYAGRFGIETLNYRDITESARRQLEEYFCDSVFPNPVLAPYKEPLNEDEWRASYKHALWYEVVSTLDDLVTKPHSSEHAIRTELLDEILFEVRSHRADGLSYSRIRQDRSLRP